MKKLIVFASGSGSNAENLVRYFEAGKQARVVAIFCNNPTAGVLQRAEKLGIPAYVFNKEDWKTGNFIDEKVASLQPDLIILAGFLWLFPTRLLHLYPNRVLNIHPALLPKYGGKGMYGDHVHRAVLNSNETNHGVTVHLVNEHFDEGEILKQESFEIQTGDTLDVIVAKIHAIEFDIYPKAIEEYLKTIV